MFQLLARGQLQQVLAHRCRRPVSSYNEVARPLTQHNSHIHLQWGELPRRRFMLRSRNNLLIHINLLRPAVHLRNHLPAQMRIHSPRADPKHFQARGPTP